MSEQGNEFDVEDTEAHIVLGDNPVEDEDVEAHVRPPRDTDWGTARAEADQPSGAARRERRGTQVRAWSRDQALTCTCAHRGAATESGPRPPAWNNRPFPDTQS